MSPFARLGKWFKDLTTSKRAPYRKGDQRRRKLVMEVLEDRILPAFGTPAWVEQGPGPITGGQTEGLTSQNNPVAGAVEAIAAHPTNPDIAIIGTVNGGIWTTTNATASSPTWIPRTDHMPTLSIGAIAYSPINPNTVFAGTGSFSSAADEGGPALGVLRSLDGGVSWSQVGGNTLNFMKIRSILPTPLNGGQVIFVGTTTSGPTAVASLWRSSNNGDSFDQISGTGGLPLGACFSIVADGADSNTYFASVGRNDTDQGVFRSTDGGNNWTNVSSGISGLGGAAVRIELAAHYDSNDGSKALYCAVVAQADGELTGVFRSTNGGGTWTAMDAVQTTEGPGTFGLHPSRRPIGSGSPQDPGSQGASHFSMVADRTNEFVVYVGGDRQPAPGPDGVEKTTDDAFPNSIGAIAYSGRHFRGDASQSSGNQWYAINAVGLSGNPNDGANGTSPHADSREMVFDANGNILEADDGGIYRLTNPNSPARTWVSVNGDLRATEFFSVAYDWINSVIVGGTQDDGSIRQTMEADLTWATLTLGDGGIAQVDTTSSGNGNVIYYTTYFQLQEFRRRTYNNTNTLIGDDPVGLIVSGQALKNYDSTIQPIPPYVLNAVDATRMLIGTTELYESMDRGDNLTDLNWAGGSGGTIGISAMAYGGWLSGVSNPDVIYAGRGGVLRLRTTAGGAFTLLSSYSGSSIRDIVLDPDNWQRAYVLDASGRVWRTTDAGASFTNITSNLLGLLPSGSTDLRTIEMYSRDYTSDVGDAIFVGGLGGVYGTADPEAGSSASWVEFGAGLPNYLVRDLRYEPTTEVLLVGGFGRGAWTVTGLDDFVDPGTTVFVDGLNRLVVTDDTANGKNDTLTISRNGNNVRVYDPNNTLTAGNGATQVNANTVEVPLAAITSPQGIVVDTQAGNDTLTIDYSGGDIGMAINYNGGDPTSGTGDKLVLVKGASSGLFDTVTHRFDSNDAGRITLDPDGGSLSNASIIVYSGLEGITDSLDVINRVFTFNAGTEVLSLSDIANTGGTHMRINSDVGGASLDFANPTGALTINAGTGDDTIHVSSIDASFGASLIVNGDAGNDRVVFGFSFPSTPFNFGPNKSLDIDLQNDAATGDIDSMILHSRADLVFSGFGSATLKASGQIWLPGASLITENGDITIEANQQTTPTAGDFTGILLTSGATIRSAAGVIKLHGRGGDDPTTTGHHGIYEDGSSSITSTVFAPIDLNGIGGTGAGSSTGVSIYGGVATTGSAGGIVISGQGGSGGSDNDGVYVHGVRSTQTGEFAQKIEINGTAGTGDSDSAGVRVGLGIGVTSKDGDVQITGHGNGTSGGTGVVVEGQVTSTGAADIIINGTGGTGGDSSNDGVVINTNFEDFTVNSSGTGAIHIIGQGGGGTGDTHAGVRLWGKVESTGTSAATITITGTGGAAGNGNTGLAMEGLYALVSSGDADITLTGTAGGPSAKGVIMTDATVVSAGTGNVVITGSGTGGQPDIRAWVNVGTSQLFMTGNVTLLQTWRLAVNGTVPGVNHGQLNVTGTVDLGNATLNATGTLTSAADVILIDNDDADPIIGTFNGLAEGAVVTVNGLPRKITYVGGTGNDVVLEAFASVGDFVWADQDSDGIQDPGEPGVADVVVELFDSVDGTIGNGNDVSLGVQFTDADGRYRFIGPAAAPAGYYLVFQLPAGLSFTTRDAGGSDAKDSDADPSTGRSALFTLPALTHNLDLDAGLMGPGPDFGFALHAGTMGSDDTNGSAVATDGAGNVYVTGRFEDTVDFDPGTGVFNLTSALEDTFIAKYTSTGTLVWARQLGPWVSGLAVDGAGNVYATGTFNNTPDFDPGVGVFNLTSSGNDVFVLKLDSDGNFAWARQLGSGSALSFAVAVDSAGNVLTMGYFYGTADFDPGSGTFNLTTTTFPFGDVFVSKLDSSGDFVWACQFANSSHDGGTSWDLALDGADNVYTTGDFSGTTTDFDPGAGTFNLVDSGEVDRFVSKLDSSGNFAWARQFTTGQRSFDGGGVAVDSTGNVYITGSFHGTRDFDPGAGTVNLTSAVDGFTSTDDTFVLKLDSGGDFVWARQLGGSSNDYGNGLALDPAGGVYTTGRFGGTVDFDPGADAFNLVTPSSNDVFISKLDSGGNFVWARQLGGPGQDNGAGVAIDPAGGVYTTGGFGGTADFAPGAGTYFLTSAGFSDMFLSKLNQQVIGDRVWSDTNSDGIQDPGELGLAGVVVELFNSVDGTIGNGNDVSLGVQSTDANGNYRFLGPRAAPAGYYLAFQRPVGFGFTTQDAGGNDNTDSDANPSTGRTALFKLPAGTNHLGLDAGLDNTSPTVSLTSTASSPTNRVPIPVTVTFSKSVTGFTLADLNIGNGTASNLTGSGSTYTFDLIPTIQGGVTVDLAADVAQDSVGNGNTAASQFSIVANYPLLGGIAASQAVTNLSTIAPFSAVTIKDFATQILTVTITFPAANGTFNTGSFSGAAGSYTFTGKAAAAQAALQALVFTPTPDQVAEGSSVTTAFTLTVNDGVASVADSRTTVVATSVLKATTPLGKDATATFNTADQTITLAGTVTSNFGLVNEGTLTFSLRDSLGNLLGTSVTSGTVVDGQASADFILPGGTPVDSFTIKVAYNGGAIFPPSSESSKTLTIVKAATITEANKVEVNFGYAGKVVQLNASITSSGGAINEGTVTFTVFNSSGQPVADPVISGILANGQAQANVTLPGGLTVGTYQISAKYQMGSNFDPSSDSSQTLIIARAPTIPVGTSINVSFHGANQLVTLKAKVTSDSSPVNGGTVTFTVRDQAGNIIGKPVSSGEVVAGQALASYVLPGGTPMATYAIAVVYNGAQNFDASREDARALTIVSGPTTLTKNATLTFKTQDQRVALGATVFSKGVRVNEGTVTFVVQDGSGKVIGNAVTSGPVTRGRATATFTLPGRTPAGTYQILASYSGGATAIVSSDISKTLKVNLARASMGVKSIQTTLSASEQTLVLTATLTSKAGPINEGTITFTVLDRFNKVVGQPVTSQPVANGQALANWTLPAGTPVARYKIVAVYSSPNFASLTGRSTLKINNAG